MHFFQVPKMILSKNYLNEKDNEVFFNIIVLSNFYNAHQYKCRKF